MPVGDPESPVLSIIIPTFNRSEILKKVLDAIAGVPLIEANVPTSMEIHKREGHPLQWLHGPLKDPYLVVNYGSDLGLGSKNYQLVDVYPVKEEAYGEQGYIPAE